jgi:hypothetical protein
VRQAPKAQRRLGPPGTPLSPAVANGVAAIPPALLGWLKLLHGKANLCDDWSRSGRPDSSWDNYSTTPFLSWHRFDLIDSTYALAVLADRTPAWRELYVELLDRMLARYITWWGALDWMTQEGDDPARADYPPEWKGTVVPAELFGRYNAPGWTGNGLEPWGFQPDPIGADGNLFYKGFLSLMLGLRCRISGEDTSTDPFVVIADYDGGWIYSHDAVLQTLERQWGSRPEGCHCENTKIWPYCLSAAALGLHVSDAVRDTEHVWVFDQWFEHAECHYFEYADDGKAQGTVFYYDPIAEIALPGNPGANMGLALYLGPQRHAIAAQVVETVSTMVGWSNENAPVAHIPEEPRFAALGHALANEFGDEVASRRLADFASTELEPTWTRDGSFYYGFNLGEEHPRGQPNATMMLAEAIERPGDWARATGPVTDERFNEPTVEEIDFPTLGVNQAAYDATNEALTVSTYAATPTDGASSTFAVTGLGQSDDWSVSCDGQAYDRARVVDGDSLAITCSIADHTFKVTRRPPAD